MVEQIDHAPARLVRCLTPYSNEIYLWEGVETPPARLRYGDVLLERFMDRIYVPSPIETLAPAQLALVNSLRRSLVLRDEVDRANEVVKRLFAAVVESEGAHEVMDWGCGYSSMETAVPASVSLSCVDLDPQVVRWQLARGCRCYHTSQTLLPASFDAIVSVFVFHFRIAMADIAAMASSLRPNGFLLANVYRRADASRTALRAEFERHHFTVVSCDDPKGLCARHEYWAMSRGRTPDDLAGLLRRAVSGSGSPAACAGL